MNLRVAFFAALMCLPATMIIAMMVFFCVAKVPGMIAQEPRRITMEYREAAEELKKNPDLGETSGVRKKSWRRQSGKIDSLPWGRTEHGDKATVWCQTGEGKFLFREIDRVEEFDHALVFYGGGVLIAFVLTGLSALCIVNFIGFEKKRDDFFAATAHDLATPLVAMRYHVGRENEEVRVLVERLIRLVENVKCFLLAGSARRALERVRVDVVEAYASAYSLFAADYRDVFDGKDVDTVFIGPPGASYAVFADELALQQILWNVLGNDLKYAAPYGRVRVEFSVQGPFVTVRFIDEGPGMKPSELKKAFSRHYRARSVMKSGKGGFGIGLCTAKELAEAMGGKLTLAANRPQGCVFTLTLPRACAVDRTCRDCSA